MFNIDDYKKLSIDEQHKEVYAYFGLAIYYSQVLEHQLLNMLLLANTINEEITVNKDYEKCFYSISNKTLGKLIKHINKYYCLRLIDRKKLESLLKRRNYLAHHYFKDNIGLFATESGRMILIKYFDDFTTEMISMDQIMNGYVKNYISLKIDLNSSSRALLKDILAGKDISTLQFNRRSNQAKHAS